MYQLLAQRAGRDARVWPLRVLWYYQKRVCQRLSCAAERARVLVVSCVWDLKRFIWKGPMPQSIYENHEKLSRVVGV